MRTGVDFPEGIRAGWTGNVSNHRETIGQKNQHAYWTLQDCLGVAE
jgi:hypothetical protein